MMINWFGFASMAETIAESKVKGCVNIATIPHAQGGNPVSLSVYWVLGLGAGSPHRDIAYRFLRHCLSAKMDKLLTLEGGIGCRKSTWEDVEVNRLIPFYRQMSSLHAFARELPRRSDWAKLATLIDQLVVDTINTQQPIEELVARYQSQVA
jgi:multiple sugar transport system substrate-binding protein